MISSKLALRLDHFSTAQMNCGESFTRCAPYSGLFFDGSGFSGPFFLQYVTENFEQKGFPIPHCVLKDALLNLLVKMRLDFIFL